MGAESEEILVSQAGFLPVVSAYAARIGLVEGDRPTAPV